MKPQSPINQEQASFSGAKSNGLPCSVTVTLCLWLAPPATRELQPKIFKNLKKKKKCITIRILKYLSTTWHGQSEVESSSLNEIYESA